MKSNFDKILVHQANPDIYDSGRFLKKSLNYTLSKLRGMNLGRSVPKVTPPLTYTPPTTNPHSHVYKNTLFKNKDKLVNSFPSNSLAVNSFLLNDLQKKKLDDFLVLCFRFFPEHTIYKKYEFPISNEANKMLMHVFTSLGLSKMLRLSTPDLFLNTRIHGGLHNILSSTAKTPFSKVIEFITFYNGMYGRLIIFVSLGVGCTVWYNFIPGVPEVAPPGLLVPRELPYESFKDVSFDIEPFMKMSYVEYKYISDQVLSAFENVYPFTEIQLPSLKSHDSIDSPNSSNARVAFGLGIIVAVFLAMGMMSYSSPPDLDLITTYQVQELKELIATRK